MFIKSLITIFLFLKSSLSLADCSIMDIGNNMNVDSCLVQECRKAGGRLTDNGCECSRGKSFVGFDKPGCYDYQQWDDSSQSNHINVTRAVDVDGAWLASSLKDYTFNAFWSQDLPFFLFPNALENIIHSTNDRIEKKEFRKFLTIPYVYTESGFGDISYVSKLSFDTKNQYQASLPYAEIINNLSQHRFKKSSQFFSKRGCLDYCVKKESATIQNKNFIIEMTYIGGVLFSNEINIYENGSDIIETKVDLGGRWVLSRTKDNHFANKFRLRSFDGKFDTSYKLDLVASDKQQPAISNQKRYDKGGVVLCDNGIKPSEIRSNSLAANVMKGPSSESYYGWLSNVRDQQEYLSGLVNLNKNGFIDNGPKNHALSVIKQMEAVNVAPLTVNTCLKDFSKWSHNALKNGFNVINYAYAKSMDQESCLMDADYQEVEKNGKEEKFLWVFSAGNGKKYQTPENSKLCPQNRLAGKDNVIIVGSETGFGGVTNKGKRFVDLFARARTTSEASGIVSSFAANLSKRYPKLSPKQIRLAILVGVEHEDLDSRSRGYLHKDNAKKAAEILNENPSIALRDLNEEVHCGTWGCWRSKLDKLVNRFKN